VSEGTGFGTRVVGLLDGDELVAAVPGCLTRRGPFRLFGSPLRGTMTSYLGPVTLDPRFADGAARDLMVECAAFARRKWLAPYAQFTTRDAPPDPVVLPGPGWHHQRPSSYRLDLTRGEDALFDGLKPKCRRNVRKAAREGVVIVELGDADQYHRILDETFRRHGSVSWHTPRFFHAIMRDLPARGLLRAWAARYQGQIIAAGLFLCDDREMHFLSGASLPHFGSLPTSYLLHWHAIATAARDGLEVFNSEASRIPSIDAFKESYNPVLERRSTLIHAPGALWTARRWFVALHKRRRRIRGKERAPEPVGAVA
jgi:hypothetical protein